MTHLYTSKYEYTHELIHSFCRIHLWYHRRQHPLFLKVPGVFLVGCLMWRIISLWKTGTSVSFVDGMTLVLIAIFSFIILWMGFVHPYVFERALHRNLDQMNSETIVLIFYEDHIKAESERMHAEYSYAQIGNSYITTTCIFLYVNRDQALLIPFDSLPERDRISFQKFLINKLPGKLSKKAHIA